MQGSSSTSVSGTTPADIAKANATLASKYPGAKVARVEEGTEVGVRITVPFKTEKDAFAFLTTPTTLNPSGATSGAGTGASNAQALSPALVGGVGLAAIAIGFIIGLFGPWRRMFGQGVVPAPAPAADLAAFAPTPQPSAEAEPVAAPSSWTGPPAGTPPPTSGPGA